EVGIEVIYPVDCTRKTQRGDEISVHYRGTLESDGSEFDESYKRGSPFTFHLGEGEVIAGWDHGLLDMCIGEERKLTIPPEMGYGSQDMGSIPPDSTLIFETKLMGIKGVDLEAVLTARPSATLTSITNSISTSASSSSQPNKASIFETDNDCRLLGNFALLVQAALGGLAVLSLVWKRWRERPRRPVKVWSFDVSKQVVGSVLLHVANLFMSMLSSGSLDIAASAKDAATHAQAQDGRQPNPCSFYLLNIFIDTTIGIPILVILLRLLHVGFSYTPLATPPESIRSGNYGRPPRYTWWLKQCLIYFIGLFGMKLCVFLLFALLPWIAWVGDWALRWTEGNEAIQITFVMFIFPLVMNAMQYYIIDSFIKDPAGGEGHEDLSGEEEHEERRRLRMSEDSDSEDDESDELQVGETAKGALKEANPTAVPIRENEDYDPNVDGASS
ncbi:hypothetical protein M501DRAFT_903008, partial [Patellaria atrata CBS 101060]